MDLVCVVDFAFLFVASEPTAHIHYPRLLIDKLWTLTSEVKIEKTFRVIDLEERVKIVVIHLTSREICYVFYFVLNYSQRGCRAKLR